MILHHFSTSADRAHGNGRISLNFWSCASRFCRLLRNNAVSGSRTRVWSFTSIIIVYRQHSDEHQNTIFCDHSGRNKERKVQNRDGTTVRGISAAPAIYCVAMTTMNGPRRRQMAPESRNPRPMSAGTPLYGDGARNGRPTTPWMTARVQARARDRGSRILRRSLRNPLAQLQKLSELEQNSGEMSIIGF